MTVMLRVLLILISLGTFLLMMRKIRQAKVQIEAAIFWVVFALVLVGFSLFPSAADFMAQLLGIYSTPNFLFLSVIFLLMIKVFYMTIHISQLETQLKTLVQKMALDEKERGEEMSCPAGRRPGEETPAPASRQPEAETSLSASQKPGEEKTSQMQTTE